MQPLRLVQGAGSRSRVSSPVETGQALAGLLLAAHVPTIGQKLVGSWLDGCLCSCDKPCRTGLEHCLDVNNQCRLSCAQAACQVAAVAWHFNCQSELSFDSSCPVMRIFADTI